MLQSILHGDNKDVKGINGVVIGLKSGKVHHYGVALITLRVEGPGFGRVIQVHIHLKVTVL